ncbi:MAG: hypothetical protein ACRCWS_01795 [Propionibacteriaceae bacterium]
MTKLKIQRIKKSHPSVNVSATGQIAAYMAVFGTTVSLHKIAILSPGCAMFSVEVYLIGDDMTDFSLTSYGYQEADKRREEILHILPSTNNNESRTEFRWTIFVSTMTLIATIAGVVATVLS